MARSYGPRFDTSGDRAQHARVAQAADYSIEIPLYQRHVGNGVILCRMLKAPTPARRIVQLIARYTDAGVEVDHIVQCDSEQEEIHQLERLEKLILQASRRPTTGH